MIKIQKIYECDCCGVESQEPDDYLVFVGNVMHPDDGEFIGNNIAHDFDHSLIVFENILCKKCVRRILSL